MSGGLEKDSAGFLLWAVDRTANGGAASIRGSIAVPSASAYDIQDDVVAVGCPDGTVKLWDLRSYGVGWEPLRGGGATKLPHTVSLSTRTGLAIPPFLKSRSSLRVTKVCATTHRDYGLRAVGATANGAVTVWDAEKSQVLMQLSSDK